MRCPYCFQPLAEQTSYCPHCGSKLPAGSRTSPSPAAAAPTSSVPQLEASKATPAPPLTARQTAGLVGGLLLTVTCACLSLVALVRPSLLPQPVVAALPFLASPTPLPTSQGTRAPFVTPTAITFAEHTNTRAGITVKFPAGWLVVDQTQTGWQDDISELNREVGWVATLFETGFPPTNAQSRAVDPVLIDLPAGRVVAFTVGELAAGEGIRSLEQLEAIPRDEPQRLATLGGVTTLLTDPQLGEHYQDRRSERLQVGGHEAILLEYATAATFIEQDTLIRVRMYFIPAGDTTYFISYFADEQSARQNRGLYDQIIQSFTIHP